MPDPFDFISTRSEINDVPTLTSLDLPKTDNVSLIPLVSADNRTNPETSVLDNIVNSVNLLPDNSPAYEYKAKEERRYSNPYLQFTNDTKGRGDIENVYGQNQGSGEQLVNGIIKMGALAGATFISSYASIPSSLDLIRSGKAIDAFKDDATFSAVQNWTEGIEDQFPNYYTQWERDHPYLSIISPTGFANVWGDKVIKNIGFTVGGLAAGITQGAILEVATGGLGSPLAFMKAAKTLEGTFGSLIRGFRNLSKVGIVGKTEDVLRGLEYTKDSLEAIKSVSRLNQIRTGATLTATTYLSAQGEAFIEGYHTYIDTKKQLLEEAYNEGNISPDRLNEIEKKAMDAGRYTTGLNIPLLMASNLVQFPIILGGKAFGSVEKGFIGKSLEGGIKFTNDHTFRKGLKAWGKEALEGFVSEGLEEGNQYFIGNSLHDYYTDKIDPQAKKSIAEYMLNNIPKVLRDKQFQEEAFFGGLSGVAMGAPFARKYFQSSKTQSTVDHLNNVYDNFNKSVKNFAHTIQLQDTTDNPDGKHNADIAHKALFSAVHDSLKVGTYDMHQDILEDMKHLSLEDFNKTFGTTFENENDKLAYIQGLVYESEQIKKDIINTNKYFMTNPFTQNKLLQKVKQAVSSKSEYAIANAQERLFEDFKELTAFNQSRLRTVGNNLSQKITSLKTLGAKDESIQYLISILGSPKGLANYLQWKGTQLEALNKSVAYFEKMKDLGTDLDPTLKTDMDREYKEAIKRKQFLESYMNTLSTEKDQDKLMQIILMEETSGEQQTRFMDNLKKTAKEAADLQAQQTNLEVEQEDLTSPDSQTAEQLINLNEQVGEQNTPVDTEAELVPPTQDPSKWTQQFKAGDNFRGNLITQVLEDAIVVQDDKGINYRVTFNGQYKQEVITTSPTEQMQSQAPLQSQTEPVINTEQDGTAYNIQKALKNIEASYTDRRFSLMTSLGVSTGIIQDPDYQKNRTIIVLTKEEQEENNRQFKAFTKNLLTAAEFNEWRQEFSKKVLTRVKNELLNGSLTSIIEKEPTQDPVEEYLAEPEVEQVQEKPTTPEQAEEVRGKKTEVPVYHPVTFSTQAFTYQDIIDNPGSYFSLDKVAFPSGKLYTAKIVDGKPNGEIVAVEFDSTMEKNKGLGDVKRPYGGSERYKNREFRQVLWNDSKELVKEEVKNDENEDKNTNYIEMFFKDNNTSLKDSVLLLINKGMIKLEC